jgi:3-dehydroquinate synthase
MGQDKKVRDGRLAFILGRDIGQAFVSRDVDLGVVEALLGEALAARAG